MNYGAHIPPVQLTARFFRALLDLADLQEGDVYLELGSGEGNGMLEAAKRGAIVRGVEYDPETAERSVARLAKAGYDVDVEIGDALKADLSGADVIVMYMSPSFYERLAPRFETVATDSLRIVAGNWPIMNWINTTTTVGSAHPVWLYEPGAAHGQLHVSEGSDTVRVVEPSRSGEQSVLLTSHNVLPGVELHDVTATADVVATIDGQRTAVACQCSASTADVVRRGQAFAVELAIDASAVDPAAHLETTITISARTLANDAQVPIGEPISRVVNLDNVAT